MLTKTINCEICGKELKAVGWKHLRTHSMTVDQYKTQFPTAKLYSDESALKKSQGAKQANANRQGKPRSEEVKRKISNTKKQNPTEPWNKGMPLSDKHKSHLSTVKRDLYASGKIHHWNTGNQTPDKVKKNISDTALSQHRTYSDTSKHKRSITMNKLYDDGWIHPSRRPMSIQQRKNTMFERYGVDNFMQQHIKPSVLSKLNDRDWLYNEHVELQKPITQICRELNLHWKNSNSMVKSRLHKFNIPQQYDFSSSYPEKEIRLLLDELGIEYVGNDRTQISPKELDIYIPSLNVAIEYCGLMWHSEAFVDKNYHKIKYDLCKESNIRLITIFEDEWLHRRDIVITKLQHVLGGCKLDRVYARRCQVEVIDRDIAKDFLHKHHIQGNGPGSISLGLKYNEELIAVVLYRNDGGGNYLLNRFATSKTVVGGFTKLERYFDMQYDPSSVTTFADLRWSNGNLYDIAGYELVSTLRPDYTYIDKTEFTRIHKFNFRHNRLATKLDVYDPTMSETENCRINGWYRIYNCGLLKYVRISGNNL